MGAPNAGGVGQNRRLSQITGYILKTVQDRRMVSIKVEFHERDALMSNGLYLSVDQGFSQGKITTAQNSYLFLPFYTAR